MKKQILILAIFTLALFAGTSTAFGQALPGSAPRGTACVDDALHPIAGKPYTYELVANPTGGDFLWWATKDPTFVSTDAAGVRTYNNDAANLLTVANGDMLAAGANYNVAGTANTVEITWSDALLANTVYNTNPTFVTTLYNNAVCADNLKVYQLDPIMAFTVDIINYDGTTPLAYDVLDDQCIDIVSSAVFSGTAMNYLYGENIFVYEVIAANFTGSYTPAFVISGLNAVQTSVIEWTYDAPATWGVATVWNAATVDVTTTETNTSTGVSIYVRVTVTNNNYEGLAALTFDLAVDGMNSVGDWDVDNGDGTACDQTTITGADLADVAQQTIEPRPSLVPGTTSPTAPNTTLITGDEQN
ncbi:MAG: hypothetical protein HN977_05175 [Gammaproteobacteria bacterium]|jgi:hypothetical protein|nr:hypothetical protein [Gammaproteobacteria bacterium]